MYGEDAVRVTPPNSTVNLTVSGDEVEGPNGECPPVSFFYTHIMAHWKLTLAPLDFDLNYIALQKEIYKILGLFKI